MHLISNPSNRTSFNLIFTLIYFSFLTLLSSCSVSKHKATPINLIDSSAQILLNNKELKAAHAGISIYNPVTNTYLYNYQGDKYFIPASNTKIMTCYAAMKYLGDSLIGLNVFDYQNELVISPTGDPTLLHPDYKIQPVLNFLLHQTKPIYFKPNKWEETAFGAGWSWDDYLYDYSAERSAFPIYGNVLNISGTIKNPDVQPPSFLNNITFNNIKDSNKYTYEVKRQQFANLFSADSTNNDTTSFSIPFITSDSLSVELLSNTFGRQIKTIQEEATMPSLILTYKIHSQPTDSMLKTMMHRSDNFFAEQSLLMVSNEMLGLMSDAKIIDTLLKTDFNMMPQPPQWVDGSGLSRYNLFTPQDFIFVLNKMRNEFSWNRITTIFPTGGTGTLSSRYKNYFGKIFAKTGSLSNNLSISGYLITNKGQTYIFSIMVGNYMSSGIIIRNAIESFLESVINNY